MSGTTLACAVSPRGEVVLRQRDDLQLELRVNGVFVMDTAETATEQALARLTLEWIASTHGGASPAPLARVVVGGLGLGFTVRELVASPLVTDVVVAEIEPALLEWHRAGLVPHTVEALRDYRVRLVEGDVRSVVEGQPRGSLDAVILDVDNGPGFLVYDANVALYETAFLARCRSALTKSGFLVIWSSAEARELEEALAATFGEVEHHAMPVRLGKRAEHYHAYVAPKAANMPRAAAARIPPLSPSLPPEPTPCPGR